MPVRIVSRRPSYHMLSRSSLSPVLPGLLSCIEFIELTYRVCSALSDSVCSVLSYRVCNVVSFRVCVFVPLIPSSTTQTSATAAASRRGFSSLPRVGSFSYLVTACG
jgi:hypothetical protein